MSDGIEAGIVELGDCEGPRWALSVAVEPHANLACTPLPDGSYLLSGVTKVPRSSPPDADGVDWAEAYISRQDPMHVSRMIGRTTRTYDLAARLPIRGSSLSLRSALDELDRSPGDNNAQLRRRSSTSSQHGSGRRRRSRPAAANTIGIWDASRARTVPARPKRATRGPVVVLLHDPRACKRHDVDPAAYLQAVGDVLLNWQFAAQSRPTTVRR